MIALFYGWIFAAVADKTAFLLKAGTTLTVYKENNPALLDRINARVSAGQEIKVNEQKITLSSEITVYKLNFCHCKLLETTITLSDKSQHVLNAPDMFGVLQASGSFVFNKPIETTRDTKLTCLRSFNFINNADNAEINIELTKDEMFFVNMSDLLPLVDSPKIKKKLQTQISSPAKKLSSIKRQGSQRLNDSFRSKTSADRYKPKKKINFAPFKKYTTPPISKNHCLNIKNVKCINKSDKMPEAPVFTPGIRKKIYRRKRTL